jgi:pyruvate dehydrogenase E1 component alpha subunit
MLLIREVEERLARNFKEGVLPGNVHLYVGEEAVAAGVCAHLTDRDWITSTHRGHGHFLAKGGEPEGLFAEIYGRAGGICKGFGGSMHVADFSKGIVGANGIVGAGIPIATGAALAAQMDGDSRVAVAFFGDGASNRGVLMESLNIATLWRLPLVFVCENNGFCEFSPLETVTAGAIHARAAAFGIPSQLIDGNDVELVWRTAGAAIDRARTGEGPSFIEAHTYRLRGHNESEIYWLSEPYRTEEEVARWREKDPLPRFAERLRRDGVADAAKLAAIAAEVTARVATAALAAADGALPSPDLLWGFLISGGLAAASGRENA